MKRRRRRRSQREKKRSTQGKAFWLGLEKGPARVAQKEPTQKGARARSTGGVQGNSLYCGTWGHRLNECRKKTADMEKGTGKGTGQGWNSPNYGKGKGKDQKGSWKGKGAWGKGGKGKGTYHMEDDWSAGQSGYSFYVPMFLNSPEVAGEWQVARSNKPTKPAATMKQLPSRCGATSTGTCTTCPCPVNHRTLRCPL